jgi:hypothetical protein
MQRRGGRDPEGLLQRKAAAQGKPEVDKHGAAMGNQNISAGQVEMKYTVAADGRNGIYDRWPVLM